MGRNLDLELGLEMLRRERRVIESRFLQGSPLEMWEKGRVVFFAQGCIDSGSKGAYERTISRMLDDPEESLRITKETLERVEMALGPKPNHEVQRVVEVLRVFV